MEPRAAEILMRSVMFVPGHRPRMIERALGLGGSSAETPDVAILDLEDGVPPAEKANARSLLAAALPRQESGRGPAPYVRINAIRSGELEADLAAVVARGLQGIVAPKVDVPAEIELLARALEAREAAARLDRGSIRLMPSIESAKGLLNAPAIAACSDRVVALLFGAEDFALDLGLPARREGEAADLAHARASVVVAAVAARKAAIDGIWPDIVDADGLRRDALRGRRLGFAGKSCIHPGQIETINEVFSPSDDEVAYAARVLEAYAAARARGDGALALDGKLLDAPIIERARRTLDARDAVARGAAARGAAPKT